MNSVHPTLRSLWDFPHILRFPDPMPPAPDVLKLIQQRIAECQVELHTLDPRQQDYPEQIYNRETQISILEDKIQEIHRAFPDLIPSEPAANTNSATPNSPHKNSGQNSEVPSPQQDQQWPNSGQPRPDSGQPWPNPGQPWPQAGQDPRANASKKIFEDLGRYSLLIM
jgi:hypothetical protein